MQICGELIYGIFGEGSYVIYVGVIYIRGKFIRNICGDLIDDICG